MRVRSLSFFLFFLSFFLLNLLLNPGAYGEEEKRAVVIVADYITLQDLHHDGLPHINSLIREGGLALMNTNTAGGRVRENSFVTMGAGKVALGGGEAALAYQAGEDYHNEPAGEIFRRRTGRVVSPASVVHLGIAGIIRANEGKNNTGSPGLLGEILHKSGLKTAVIGNADTEEHDRRHAAAIAMDGTGIVDQGYTGGETLRTDGEKLLLRATDYQKTAQLLKETMKTAHLTVVETGDTTRLEHMRNTALDSVFLKSKEESLKKIDRFIGDVRHISGINNFRTLLLIVAPTPSSQALEQKNYLTPLIYWQKEALPGLLTSGTTRREGIVANTDIAPTILEHFSLPVPGEMSGRPMTTVKVAHTMEKLLSLNQRLVFVHKARPPLVKGYILGQIIVLGAAALSLITGLKILKYLQPVLLALSSFPLVLLIMGMAAGLHPVLYGLAVLGIVLLITGVSMGGLRIHNLCPFLIVSLLTAGAILLDLVFGAPLMQNSVLGYDPMGGARYYGLGNEYMGVLIGSLIMGTASLIQIAQNKKVILPLILLIYLLAVILIALPNIGTNGGGALAAIAGLGFTAYQICPTWVTKKQFTAILAALLVLFIALAGWDASRPAEVQSHFGRTINLMGTKGISEAYNIITRKVALNIKLIRWTIWSQVFLATLLSTALLFYRPVGLMKKVQEKYPYLIKGFWGVVLGSLAALLFNDSGIVAAATMSIFAAAPLVSAMGSDFGA